MARLPAATARRIDALDVGALRHALDSRGFAVVDRAVLDAAELAEVRRLGEELLADYEPLRRLGVAGDLGVHDTPVGAPAIAEIRRASDHRPQLRETAVFRAVESLATRVLAGPVHLRFDHFIHKAPGNGLETAWHQDAVYGAPGGGGDSVHLWVPLQATGVADGCLRFVPTPWPAPVVVHARQRAGMQSMTVVGDVVHAPVPAGGLTMHRPTTPHGAGANEGTRDRWVWTLQFERADPVDRLRDMVGGLRRRVGV